MSQTSSAEQRHPSLRRHEVSLGALWFGLFGAPAAWTVQMLVDYATDAHACYPRYAPLAAPVIGDHRLWLVVLLVSVSAVLVGVAALVTAVHGYRATRDESGGDAHALLEVGEGRTRFMTLSGVIMSSLFLFASVIHAVTLFVVSPCSY